MHDNKNGEQEKARAGQARYLRSHMTTKSVMTRERETGSEPWMREIRSLQFEHHKGPQNDDQVPKCRLKTTKSEFLVPKQKSRLKKLRC